MRNELKNRIMLTVEEKEVLWNYTVFVFDTNVLFDLYDGS